MDKLQENTSRLISYWLRHKPEEANLIIDEFGWTEIDKLLLALQEQKISFSLSNLKELNSSFDKTRWEIDLDSNRIRATHGHSFPIVLKDKVTNPPETLYHGTATQYVSKIIANGLSPMDRQYVHLSESIEAATIVGKRHGKPFVIEIKTEQLIKDGWTFYKTSDSIWLTTIIPAKYLSFEPWYPIDALTDGQQYTLKELKKEIGFRIFHPLYRYLKNSKLVWATGRNDDKLFFDCKVNKYFLVHLSWRGKTERKGFPFFQIFTSFEQWIDKVLWEDQQDFYDLN